MLSVGFCCTTTPLPTTYQVNYTECHTKVSFVNIWYQDSTLFLQHKSGVKLLWRLLNNLNELAKLIDSEHVLCRLALYRNMPNMFQCYRTTSTKLLLHGDYLREIIAHVTSPAHFLSGKSLPTSRTVDKLWCISASTTGPVFLQELYKSIVYMMKAGRLNM